MFLYMRFDPIRAPIGQSVSRETFLSDWGPKTLQDHIHLPPMDEWDSAEILGTGIGLTCRSFTFDTSRA